MPASFRELYDKSYDSFLSNKKTQWTPEILFDMCKAYFEWCESSPVYSVQTSLPGQDQKIIGTGSQRVMTIRGLCLTLCITTSTWSRWRTDPMLCDVVSWADNIIKENKYQKAAHNMISWKFVAGDNINDVPDAPSHEEEDEETIDDAVKSVLGMIDSD